MQGPAAVYIGLNKEQRLPPVKTRKILGIKKGLKLKLIFGTLMMILFGALLPTSAIIFGATFNELSTWDSCLDPNVDRFSIAWLGFAVGALLFGTIGLKIWSDIGDDIAEGLRARYFDALTTQEVGYFDTHKVGILLSYYSNNVTAVKEGFGTKAGMLAFFVAQFIVGMIVALALSWQLTLVTIAAAVTLVGVGIFNSRGITAFTKRILGKQALSTDIANTTIGGIRTVFAFTLENTMKQRFSDSIKETDRITRLRSIIQGIANGLTHVCTFGVVALSIWYGTELVKQGKIGPGDLLAVFFAVFMGAMGLGNGLGIVPDITKAKLAAANLFDVIDRTPLIDNKDGAEPDIKGNIRLKNVTLAYPSRPDINVLKKFNLKIKAGKTTALVGQSGSGKSTIIQLLERFYDPAEGQVLIDGIDIKNIKLSYLRSQIGLVSQEPILFRGTIAENIRHGKPNATDEEVIEAAKGANAHSFIMNLADQYNTQVGERGGQLSGGQKQRIAIARAMLKNPKILLLDEATSALDAESEKLVQDALNRLSKGRTTIIVAHRLSTIQHADTICVLQRGVLVEKGTHDSLLSKQGFYSALVALQMGGKENKEK
eukprot:TRINITY_DN2937_c0_g3_i1.p1 TRINITY_DN2937_c0_g3~~TRINITY_DN2937_c0_g3_i1.p1  ORF type:complete len:600 (-),score=121.72 TRINITY_DN2937_c0_g3_i1:15-1814(-)